MKNLASAVCIVLGLTLVLSGCGAGTSEPDQQPPDTTPETPTPKTSNLTAKWSVKKADGSADTCPATYNKVKIVYRAYDTNGFRTGDGFSSQLFDCGAGTATIKLQTSGDISNAAGFTARDVSGKYDIELVLTEASGEIEHIVARAQNADLANSDKTLTFTFYPNGGFHSLDWGLDAQSTGDSLSCAAAGVDTIKLRSKRTHLPDYTLDPVGKETVDTFPCTGQPGVANTGFRTVGAGISSALEAGYYTFVVEAYSNGTLVGSDEDQEQEIKDRGRDDSPADTYRVSITTR